MLYQREMVDPTDPGWLGRDQFRPVHRAPHWCSTSSCSWPASDIDLSGFWPSAPNRPAGHPSSVRFPGWRRPPDRWGRASPNAVGLAMAARREHQTARRGTPLGRSVFDHFAAAACREGVTSEVTPPWPVANSWATSSPSATTTTSPSGATRTSPSLGTPRHASRPTGGTCSTSTGAPANGYAGGPQALHEAIVMPRSRAAVTDHLQSSPGLADQAGSEVLGAKLGGEEVLQAQAGPWAWSRAELHPARRRRRPRPETGTESTQAARAVWTSASRLASSRPTPTAPALLGQLRAPYPGPPGHPADLGGQASPLATVRRRVGALRVGRRGA